MAEIRIEVDRPRFSVRVYEWNQEAGRYRRVKTYPCALGAVGYSTPPGPYKVIGKSRTPDWMPPSWSALYTEGMDPIPFENEHNPFAGGFIALGGHPSTKGDGVGFHGTKFDPAIGTRASHGCVRMRVPNLLELWKFAETGTSVTIYGDQ